MKSSSAYIPLFYQRWWLDTIAPGKVFHRSDEGYHYTAVELNKWGLRKQFSPELTPYGGPWTGALKENGDTQVNIESFHASTDFLDEIYFRLHPSFEGLQDLRNQGYDLRERTTHLLDVSDLDLVWEGMKGSARRAIKKGQRNLQVSESHNVELLHEVHKATFDRQGIQCHPMSLLIRIYNACHARNCGKLFVARDHKQSMHAAVYVVWDELNMYYLIGGSTEEFRSSGAMSLLLWEAIKWCNELGIAQFDFEGSIIPNVARFFRGFGANPVPYFEALKTKSKLLQLRNKIKGKPW